MLAKPVKVPTFLYRLINEQYIISFFPEGYWPGITELNNEVDAMFLEHQISTQSSKQECIQWIKENRDLIVSGKIGEIREVYRLSPKEEKHLAQFKKV